MQPWASSCSAVLAFSHNRLPNYQAASCVSFALCDDLSRLSIPLFYRRMHTMQNTSWVDSRALSSATGSRDSTTHTWQLQHRKQVIVWYPCTIRRSLQSPNKRSLQDTNLAPTPLFKLIYPPPWIRRYLRTYIKQINR